jgi:TfoX/Sxy family transcriptional regulator of competence genes
MSDGPKEGPAMPKPSADAIERFKAAVADDPRVSLRPMFGNLAAFANGYLFAGLFGDDVFVRLDATAQAQVEEDGGSPFSPMPGRPMRHYVVLPTARTHDPSALATAIADSLAHTMALPPKAPKPPKATKPRAAKA